MKSKIIYLLFILLVGADIIYAQTDTLIPNRQLLAIAKPTRNEDWIVIKDDVKIDPLKFFFSYKPAMGLTVNDEMRLYKTETDKIGFTHFSFNQFNKGYRIIGAEFLLHAKEGRLATANGKRIKGLAKTPVISIIKEQALQNALLSFPSSKYAWEIPALEQQKKELQHDANASFKPGAEIVWVSISNDENSKDPDSFVLAYLFDVYTETLDGKRIFIDARNGKVIKTIPLVPNCTATSVTTNFYGNRSFSTRQIPGSNPASFNLWNDCQPAFIRTRLWNSTLANSTDYISGINNSWGAAASAATSHWGTERTYAYFLNIHGRQGWNNVNGGINIYQDALFCDTGSICTVNNPSNASFTNGFMRIGNNCNANSIDDFNSLDIIAHEFTHGVTESSSNLVYSKQSGALNESFSDILGISCYASLFGLNGNTWLVGFDRKNPANTVQSLYIRNMSNPNDRGHPDTYLSEPLWVSDTTVIDSSADNWGVHINSGVQNFMYYLLVTGGSGTNDNGTPYSVRAIGIVVARDIAYRVLTAYLTSSSTFVDARNAWVQAAVDLYGECSFNAIQTGKAWDAVGLSPPSIDLVTTYCGPYGGSVFSVTNPYTYSLSPNCTMTVTPASLVQFGANKIILNPGFRAQNGSKFRAYVSDCRFAAY